MNRTRFRFPVSLAALLALAAALAVPLEAQERGYVTNSGGSNVLAFGPAPSPTFISIEVSPTPAAPVAVAVQPDGAFAYVVNPLTGRVSVVDTMLNTEVDSIAVGSLPEGISITPDGTQAYVSNRGGGTVSVIDLMSRLVVQTIPAPSQPRGLAVSPDGSEVYVTRSTSNPGRVRVIDRFNPPPTPVDINVGAGPYDVAFSPDGDVAYVVNIASGTVSVIDTATQTVIHTLVVGTNPVAVAFLPDGSKAYVVRQTVPTGFVIPIDALTDPPTVLPSITVGMTPSDLAPTLSGNEIYVTNSQSRTLSVINTFTDTVVRTISVASINPRGITIADISGVPVTPTSTPTPT